MLYNIKNLGKLNIFFSVYPAISNFLSLWQMRQLKEKGKNRNIKDLLVVRLMKAKRNLSISSNNITGVLATLSL